MENHEWRTLIISCLQGRFLGYLLAKLLHLEKKIDSEVKRIDYRIDVKFDHCCRENDKDNKTFSKCCNAVLTELFEIRRNVKQDKIDG